MPIIAKRQRERDREGELAVSCSGELEELERRCCCSLAPRRAAPFKGLLSPLKIREAAPPSHTVGGKSLGPRRTSPRHVFGVCRHPAANIRRRRGKRTLYNSLFSPSLFLSRSHFPSVFYAYICKKRLQYMTSFYFSPQKYN